MGRILDASGAALDDSNVPTLMTYPNGKPWAPTFPNLTMFPKIPTANPQNTHSNTEAPTFPGVPTCPKTSTQPTEGIPISNGTYFSKHTYIYIARQRRPPKGNHFSREPLQQTRSTHTSKGTHFPKTWQTRLVTILRHFGTILSHFGAVVGPIVFRKPPPDSHVQWPRHLGSFYDGFWAP